MVTTHSNNELVYWNLDTGLINSRIQLSDGKLFIGAYPLKDDNFITRIDQRLVVWNVITNELNYYPVDVDGEGSLIVFPNDIILIGGINESRIWDFNTKRIINGIPRFQKDEKLATITLPNDNIIYISSGNIQIYNPKSNKIIEKWNINIPEIQLMQKRILSDTIIALIENNQTMIYNLRSKRIDYILPYKLTPLKILNNGLVAFGTLDGFLKIYNPYDNQIEYEHSVSKSGIKMILEISNRRLAIIDINNDLSLWEY